jgi:hypothetical protein
MLALNGGRPSCDISSPSNYDWCTFSDIYSAIGYTMLTVPLISVILYIALHSVDVETSCVSVIDARAKVLRMHMFTWPVYISWFGLISLSHIRSDLPWLRQPWRRNRKGALSTAGFRSLQDADAHCRWRTIARFPVHLTSFAVRSVGCSNFEVYWFQCVTWCNLGLKYFGTIVTSYCTVCD